MAKTLKKTVHELEIDLENFDVFDEQPAAGSWRRMRFLDYFYHGKMREARNGQDYHFWNFVQWYGPTQ